MKYLLLAVLISLSCANLLHDVFPERNLKDSDIVTRVDLEKKFEEMLQENASGELDHVLHEIVHKIFGDLPEQETAGKWNELLDNPEMQEKFGSIMAEYEEELKKAHGKPLSRKEGRALIKN